MPKFKPLPSQQELHRLFDYSVVTGELYWKLRIGKSIKGQVAGYVGNKGHRTIQINKVSYGIHRIIWRYMTGQDPASLEIDHIDGVRNNNAWHNLRLATHTQNGRNRSGTKGWSIADGRYRARIRHNRKLISLGYYDTEAEARAAYEEASRKLHGEFSSVHEV